MNFGHRRGTAAIAFTVPTWPRWRKPRTLHVIGAQMTVSSGLVVRIRNREYAHDVPVTIAAGRLAADWAGRLLPHHTDRARELEQRTTIYLVHRLLDTPTGPDIITAAVSQWDQAMEAAGYERNAATRQGLTAICAAGAGVPEHLHAQLLELGRTYPGSATDLCRAFAAANRTPA